MLVFRPVWSYSIILGSVWVDAGGLRGYIENTGTECPLSLIFLLTDIDILSPVMVKLDQRILLKTNCEV